MALQSVDHRSKPAATVIALLSAIVLAGCSSSPQAQAPATPDPRVGELQSAVATLSADVSKLHEEITSLKAPVHGREATLRIFTDCFFVNFAITDGTQSWSGNVAAPATKNDKANLTASAALSPSVRWDKDNGTVAEFHLTSPGVAANARCRNMLGETAFSSLTLVVLRDGEPVAFGQARGTDTATVQG